jgi:hypothetical protein
LKYNTLWAQNQNEWVTTLQVENLKLNEIKEWERYEMSISWSEIKETCQCHRCRSNFFILRNIFQTSNYEEIEFGPGFDGNYI